LEDGERILAYFAEGNRRHTMRDDLHRSSVPEGHTDPCLGWKDSETLIRDLAELV
jgi:hypothetical protein